MASSHTESRPVFYGEAKETSEEIKVQKKRKEKKKEQVKISTQNHDVKEQNSSFILTLNVYAVDKPI